jgi:3-oxoacyl-[acyl-carrier protein] reductase
MANKTALITGSSKGLGRSLARVFAQNAYDVILHGRNEEALSVLRGEILARGVNCDVVVGDICDAATIERLAALAQDRGLDVLINNAAVYVNSSLEGITEEALRGVIETNLVSPLLLIKKVYASLRASQSALIININSLASKTPGPGESLYAASKLGLRGFSASFRFEASRDRVRILDVYLGAMLTDMSKARNDSDKFILPGEAADLIFRLVLDYPSMGVDEVELKRRRY